MRATQHQPTVLIFKEFNIGSKQTVRYYELSEGNISNTPLTTKLRLSNNRKFAKSNPKFWLSVRSPKKWLTPNLTGLFPTRSENLFFGDKGKENIKESLFLFKFSENNTLKIVFYKGYYPTYKAIKELLKNI
tara:strand:- start:62 stop:457 length:396 start_codon:yes stop_codon:yes gene_type:complete